jgi:EAL domain-containing protein (putative c-di-GMP-specific phosphodiesterase class I)
MCVNLSARHFLEPDLVERVARQLEESGLGPRHLNLEITESMIMDQPDSAAATLGRLRALGVGISIDDFGTGYSSLSYLDHFPVDTVKIDRSFVDRMTQTDHAEIVNAIVTLAHGLDLEVVAEGVETEAQRRRLKALGCDFAQGFRFSRPVDAASAARLYEASLRPAFPAADPVAGPAGGPVAPCGSRA